MYHLNVLSNLSSVIIFLYQQPVSEGTQCIEDQSPISGAVFGQKSNLLPLQVATLCRNPLLAGQFSDDNRDYGWCRSSLFRSQSPISGAVFGQQQDANTIKVTYQSRNPLLAGQFSDFMEMKQY